MISLKDYVNDKKTSRVSVAQRYMELKEVKRYMKKIYNPTFYSSKPKFRKPLTHPEFILFKRAMRNLYNTKIRNNIFTDLGIRRMAET